MHIYNAYAEESIDGHLVELKVPVCCWYDDVVTIENPG